jgi:hypothetical protein
MEKKTPAELRSAARAMLARVLSKALNAAGVEQRELADACGTKSQKVQLWCDATRPETPYVADLPQMPRAVAVELLRWAAESHGALVVDQLEAASSMDHMGHLHRVLKEGADVGVVYSAALADGIVDAVEGERVISELREDIAAKVALLKMLEGDRRPRAVRGGAA